jgi:hypothetical protein
MLGLRGALREEIERRAGPTVPGERGGAAA